MIQVAHAEGFVVGDLVDRNGDGGTQQAEDQRYGRRSRESHRVVEVQQDDVGEHHAHIEHHHFVEGEKPRVEHTVAGHFHHAARGDRTQQDADRGDQQNGLHGGGFRTDGRVEEIDGVVGNAHEKARNGQDSQNNDDNGVDFAHVRDFLRKFSDKFTLKIRMDRLRRSLLTLN